MGEGQDKNTPGVYEYMFGFFQQMTEISWSKLGLTPDIISGQVEENLGEAKIAIDLTAHLASVRAAGPLHRVEAPEPK
ncbi:DUF1844 domain-containing protein, partial [bacterium]